MIVLVSFKTEWTCKIVIGVQILPHYKLLFNLIVPNTKGEPPINRGSPFKLFPHSMINVSSHSAISDVHGVRELFQTDSFQLLFPGKCPVQGLVCYSRP